MRNREVRAVEWEEKKDTIQGKNRHQIKRVRESFGRKTEPRQLLRQKSFLSKIIAPTEKHPHMKHTQIHVVAQTLTLTFTFINSSPEICKSYKMESANKISNEPLVRY